LDGKRWDVILTNAPFGKRGLPSATVLNGNVWLAGGFTLDKDKDFAGCSDLWRSADGIK
jgi:hypothetical protein